MYNGEKIWEATTASVRERLCNNIDRQRQLYQQYNDGELTLEELNERHEAIEVQVRLDRSTARNAWREFVGPQVLSK